MDIPFYVVKAFCSSPLLGNPAGIAVLPNEISKDIMQRIAYINGFPETVFLHQQDNKPTYRIWWFTPEREVFDAGHATLASQYLLFNELHPQSDVSNLTLIWSQGIREISRNQCDTLYYSSVLTMRLLNEESTITNKCSKNSTYIVDDDIVLILSNEQAIKNYTPDFDELSRLPYRGLAITAVDSKYDYCCRFFAPRYGVNEDFVTATVHKYLSLYWGSKQPKKRLSGIQYSNSIGVVSSIVTKNRLFLSGNCCIFSQGILKL